MAEVRVSRELRGLAKQARRTGWKLSYTGSTHIRWQAPSGAVVITASTPGKGRAIQNEKGYLRRAGLS